MTSTRERTISALALFFAVTCLVTALALSDRRREQAEQAFEACREARASDIVLNYEKSDHSAKGWTFLGIQDGTPTWRCDHPEMGCGSETEVGQ